jgi:hypothetical protein
VSTLLALLNVIKTQHTRDWLTPNQRPVVAWAEAQLQVPGVINLAGPPGRGKTFCGWILAQSLAAPISPDPQSLPDLGTVTNGALIIDNMLDDARAWRTLLTELQLRAVRQAVVISRHKNELGLSAIVLPPPTAADCAHIAGQISTRLPFNPGGPGEDLWMWIRSAVA